MNYYSLETKFEFGKHIQKTVKEVLSFDKPYVEWCLINLEDFCFDAFLAYDFSSDNVNFSLSEEALTALSKKLAPQNSSKENSLYENDDYESDDFDNYEEDYGSSGEKYGWYNGFSDDVIDDAFEGDPSNTWNVD